jgi:hypothetical protein
MELFQQFQTTPAQLPLMRTPKGFWGLAKYKGHVALWSQVEKEPEDQWTFAFLHVPKKSTSKSARMIRDPETGDLIYLIDTERFVSLLQKDISPSTDTVAEFAWKQALHQFGEMEGMSPELERFLSSKTTLEVLKSNIKGGVTHSINNSSEAALREIIRQFRESKRKEAHAR